MKEKIVSVIITTHNRLEFLKKAIQSVLNQSYQNIECIVVDDASTDMTRDYLESLSTVRKIYISPEESHGGNYARNLGIKYAKGEYIAFLDDDDEFFETKIEKQVRILNNNPDIGMVYCGIDIELDNGENIEIIHSSMEKLPEGDLSRYVLKKKICLTSTMIVRKSILNEIRGFDEEVAYWQEYELCIRLCQKTLVGVVKEPLVLYRKSISAKRMSNNFDRWDDSVRLIYRKHSELFAKLTPLELGNRDLYYYIEKIDRAKKNSLPKEILKGRLAILVNIYICTSLFLKVLYKMFGISFSNIV